MASGKAKTNRDESFPVASLLLSKRVRRHVLAFYSFVRAADDIADAPHLSADDKLGQLDQIEAALHRDGSDPLAQALLRTQDETGCGVAEARELLRAFRQDATKHRYASWEDLADYCALSAAPVGRFLLKLHGETEAAHAPSGALCAALQVLNHLQDCEADRIALGRIYIPAPWIELSGGEAAFFERGDGSRRAPVVNAMLDRVDALLLTAADLPGSIVDRRLSAQAAATLAIAERHSARLRRQDPVDGRPQVARFEVAVALAKAALWRRAPADKAIVAQRVARASTSFFFGMKALRAHRRAAIFAVYAYARLVDDIADAPIPAGERRKLLAVERERLDRLYAGRASGPLERELARAFTGFSLPRAEFDQLLDGMEADAADPVRIADDAGLALYCRRVAGAVGLLSVRIFGLDGSEAERFALALGEALQIINVLRDLDEDAMTGRLYLPASRLREQGIDPSADLRAILRHPRLPLVCVSLAAQARLRLAEADEAAADLDARKLRPARLMKAVYCRHLDRLEARGWLDRGPHPRPEAVQTRRHLARAPIA